MQYIDWANVLLHSQVCSKPQVAKASTRSHPAPRSGLANRLGSEWMPGRPTRETLGKTPLSLIRVDIERAQPSDDGHENDGSTLKLLTKYDFGHEDGWSKCLRRTEEPQSFSCQYTCRLLFPLNRFDLPESQWLCCWKFRESLFWSCSLKLYGVEFLWPLNFGREERLQF